LVYQEAAKKMKSISLSTVYATLNELERHGGPSRRQSKREMPLRGTGERGRLDTYSFSIGKVNDAPYQPNIVTSGNRERIKNR
jgi:hypothetical protein